MEYWPKKRWWGVWFLVVALIFSSGCMVKKDRIELGPFYYKRPLPEEKTTETAVMWPFFQWYSSEKVRQFGFRPLVNIRSEFTEEQEEALFEIQALWPLFLHRRTDQLTQVRTRLYPFFHYTKHQHADGQEEMDTALYPFFLGGRSSQEGNYFAFFPLAGKINGIFGQDRIRFLLFPLLADAKQGEHRSWHFLWPVFQYSKGGGKSSFRFFPLFGWKKKEGRYNKFFLLWPFFARVQEGLTSDHPTDSWFFLPFYANQQTPFGKIQYFLYPFFSYHRNERPGNRFREWNCPAPLVSIERGDQKQKTYLWPFWGSKKKKDSHTTFILYPIYRYEHSNYRSTASYRRYILPFYWSWAVTDIETMTTRKRVKAWPFLDYYQESKDQSEADEISQLRLLSPLWFRDPDGFERNYSDFWTFYTCKKGLDDKKRQRLLWFSWIEDGRQ